MSPEISIVNNEMPDAGKMVMRDKSLRLNDSLFSKELAPHYMQLASQLSKSSMVPKAYQGKPQDLFIAMAMGYQIGLSVEQAIQAIAVINGKPCLWGDDMLALCMAHADFVDITEEPIVENNVVIGYRCEVTRKGMSPHLKIFTLDMAKKAGLLAKPGPWTQYPDRMLQLRARSFALRDKFPDALKGIKSREEIEDYVDAEFKVVDDKSSRTEFLKKDLLNKRGEYVEDKPETTPESFGMEDKQNPEETTPSKELPALVDTGKQETEAPEETPINLAATPVQIKQIQKLLKEKQFSEDRLAKALKYYEVDNIAQLNIETAEDFILQLNK